MRIEHPYADLHGGRWLKGNLHAHTNRSDGRCAPQVVVDVYAERGYGFLMMSDHDVATTAAGLAGLEARGMVLIPGNEITANGEHLLHVNAQEVVAPVADRQVVLEAAGRVAGTFVIVNHPNWYAGFDHCKQEKLEQWQGYAGIEIYNAVIEVLEGAPLATDRWDRLLSHGRRVWGFANDDSHNPSHAGLAWNVAYVMERTVAGVMEALRQGRFYGSTGPSIELIVVDNDQIRLESADAQRIVMYGQHQRRLAVMDGNTCILPYPPGEPYVRFECIGKGGRCAWTQPFYRAE